MCIEDCTLQNCKRRSCIQQHPRLSISARPERKSCSQLRQNQGTAAFRNVSGLCEVSKCSRTTAPLLTVGVAARSFSAVPITALRMHLEVQPQPHLQLKQGVICRSPVSAELAGRLCEAVVAELRVELGAAQQLASVEGHIRILQPTVARKLRPLTWKELHQRSLLRHLRRAHPYVHRFELDAVPGGTRHMPPTSMLAARLAGRSPAANETSMRLRASLRTARHGMHR